MTQIWLLSDHRHPRS